ncbi:MAG TPA: hypothetical protein VFP50_05765 [Anaeromyxobacteraceae bacterium]|nr:hypothetical protein [Anaeromyxobacteraceae bacterium]
MSPAPRRLLLLAILLPGAARADLFSPGDLTRAHAALEGLASCTRCHEAGEQLSPDTCLDCHKELKARVIQGKGFHGRLGEPLRHCQACHHEHQGRDFKLVDWGAGGKKAFDHVRTGWALEGKHRPVDCARCHDPRRVTDVPVRQAIEKGRESWLGQPTACAACHADEHRGQLGADCQACHGAGGWKPARFDHARAAYKLDGKHAKVACARCHREEPVAPPGDVAPRTAPVRPALLVRYKPVPFQGCADCHKDPHQGRFGGSCLSCHVTSGWKEVRGMAAEKVFHEKTRYPLRGAHAQARCEACHGQGPGRPPRYRGLAFERCTDCHFDAHLGQLAATPAPAGSGAGARAGSAATCDRCHGVEGFTPARFELEQHQQLGYRLEGAHRTVACAACHPRDARLEAKVPAAVRARLAAAQRPVRPSLALFDIPRAAKDCRACHRDPHGGQLQPRLDEGGCTGCHGTDGWRPARLDHARDTRFGLTGKHATAACASCHRPGDGGAVRYKPLPLGCAGCHADPHAGQLALKGRGTDCSRCHETTGWKSPVRFDHQRDTRFKLVGKHRPLACEKCHATVAVAKGVEARRYKPLPLDCEGCHADFHRGAFRGVQP